MKKQVKIKDINIGESFCTSTWDDIPSVKIEAMYAGSAFNRINGGCFGLRNNSVVAMDEDFLVYIEVPSLHYKDIKVGEKFKIGQNTYLKIDNMMKDILSPKSNPCVCIENSFLFNCADDISVERI